jgi:hypothetical protein
VCCKVCDTTPPVIPNLPPIPPPEVGGCVEATSSAGAIVTYTLPSATDAVDGAVLISCQPPSGSVFPIATTTVTCTASDSYGNVAVAGYFTIKVLSAHLARFLVLCCLADLFFLCACRCVTPPRP